MPKRSKDPVTGLRIAQECEAMIAYAYQVLRNFPKSERHVLNQEIRDTMWTIQRHIIRAHKRYHKKTTLQDLDIEIALLKSRLTVALELRYLSPKQFAHWSKHVSTLGAMTGAWLQTEKQKR